MTSYAVSYPVTRRIAYAVGNALLGGSGVTAPVLPTAPALTWNSTSADTTPDFLVDLPSGNVNSVQDAAAGDHLIIEYQLQSGGSWTLYLDRTLISGDISTDVISATGATPVANGSYFFRARIERSPLIGTNSINASVTISATVSATYYFLGF